MEVILGLWSHHEDAPGYLMGMGIVCESNFHIRLVEIFMQPQNQVVSVADARMRRPRKRVETDMSSLKQV